MTMSLQDAPKTPESEYDHLPFTLVRNQKVSSNHLAPPPSHNNGWQSHAASEEEAKCQMEKPFVDTIFSPDKIPFKSSNRKGFLPDLSVIVTITKAEHVVSSRRHRQLNPYMYTMEVSHGHFRWTIHRRYHHFLKLHTSLFMHRNRLQLLHPQLDRQKSSVDNTEEEETDSKETSHTSKSNASKGDDVALKIISSDACCSVSKSPKLKRLRSVTSQQYQQEEHARFPRKPDFLLQPEMLEQRKRQLQDYLNDILLCEEYRNHRDTLEFLEVSELTFVKDLVKSKEGIVRRKMGEDQSRGLLKHFARSLNCLCYCFCSQWKRVWLVMQETCLVCLNPETGEISLVLLLDKGFELQPSGNLRHVVALKNLSRTFTVKTMTPQRTKDWIDAIQSAMTATPGLRFIEYNRFDSFAPVRHNELAFWFVDGQSYMAAVAEAISNAREEIYITDWWLSPEIHLKRGLDFDENLRLDKLLTKKADEGVRIYILLYKEFQLALGLNSFYTKTTLMRCGKNIKVLRSPDRSGADVNDFLWAHHEKVVVIDQTLAFVGGIDLCYGRWDNHRHQLTDIDVVDTATLTTRRPLVAAVPNTSSRPTNRSQPGKHIMYGLKAAHEVTVAPIRAMASPPPELGAKDEVDDDGEEEQEEEKGRRFRMKRRFRSVYQRARRRLRRKDSVASEANSVQSAEDTQDSSQASTASRDTSPEELGGRRISFAKIRRLRPKNGLRRFKRGSISSQTDEESQSNLENEDWEDGAEYPPMTLWRAKDYVNFIVKDVARPDLPDQDNVDRRTTPRMPWHDVSVGVQGKAARDVARHFIQRWNAVKIKKAKFSHQYPFLVPKSYANMTRVRHSMLTSKSIINAHVDCQVLRSVCSWSAGIDSVEYSIYAAMLDAISESEHYVYIENQFFITNCSGDQSSEVKNGIGKALVDRIAKAFAQKKTFRVFILLPLLPAFEGQIGSASTGNALRVILHYNYASICRGQHSLFKQLEKRGINPINYVSFCSLRTYGELLGSPVTELVYIHSKLMIVDDNIVICGSANINDRSLLGNRDSEVCLRIEDKEFTHGLMNGVKFKSGRFAGSLRRKLMREHLGLLGLEDKDHDIVVDPLSDTFYKDVWLRRAALNTKLFDDAFMSVPTDHVKTMDACKKYEDKTPLAEIDRYATLQIVKNVKGHLVLLPLHFLEDENLLPSYFAKEGMVPAVTWT